MVESQARRVLVHNHTTGKLTGLITQSRLLEFVGTIQNSISEASCTVEQLNLGFKDVASVHENSMTINAFKLMKDKKISAVAVVDDEGKLVGNISSNDLKLVGNDLTYFTYLARSVREYISWVNSAELLKSPLRNQSLLQTQKSEKDPFLVNCTKSNTLGFVIRTLNHYRVHRMYIVDDACRPIGVISIHDVLAQLMKNRTTNSSL